VSSALLLSGGMDSIAIAYWKRPTWAITIDYGQAAAASEISAAIKVCDELSIKHVLVSVDCRSLGSGDMVNAEPNEHAQKSDWWPYRNQLLVTLGCMRAIALGVNDLLLGTVRTDGSSHQDGTEQFVELLDNLVSSQEGAIRVVAPAIEYSTSELVLEANVPPEILAWAHSCHKSTVACGNCRGCNKYSETLEYLGGKYLDG